jgi:biotin-dependent carboxylase-like uncharacterized protein
MTSLEVLAPGALTTVQDLGRPGWAHIGVPRSGAADRPALKLANRLVGNDDTAAGLETTLAGPRLRFAGEAQLALAGAAVNARIGERRIPMNEPFTVAAGEELRLGNASRGLRTYVAFRGGLHVPLTLGSAATDLLTGLGPKPLERGDVLRLRGGSGGGRTIHPPAPDTPPGRGLPEPVVVRIIVGPRSDWFTAGSIKRLLSEPFTIGQASNRIGIRLDGPEMERARSGELRSEGLVAGAIQVPGDGRPIMLFVDHPTTGGYPVIAVVRSQDLPLVAQLRPGQALSFTTDVAV